MLPRTIWARPPARRPAQALDRAARADRHERRRVHDPVRRRETAAAGRAVGGGGARRRTRSRDQAGVAVGIEPVSRRPARDGRRAGSARRVRRRRRPAPAATSAAGGSWSAARRPRGSAARDAGTRWRCRRAAPPGHRRRPRSRASASPWCRPATTQAPAARAALIASAVAADSTGALGQQRTWSSIRGVLMGRNVAAPTCRRDRMDLDAARPEALEQRLGEVQPGGGGARPSPGACA